MNFTRTIKHLILPGWQPRRAFSSETLGNIEQAIAASETQHSAEIRFAVEAALDASALLRGQSAPARAIDVFSTLRVWDTEANNGVLLYLLLADCHVEIVCDRAAHAKIGSETWQMICRMMEISFKQGNFEAGVLLGIEAITQQLVKHFPQRNFAGVKAMSEVRANELPNAPALL